MEDAAPDVVMEIRGQWNGTYVNKKWTKIANFSWEIRRHGHDLKSDTNKIVLDCRMIKGGEEFYLVLESGDLDIESNFFKAYNKQKPKNCGAKLEQKDFRNGRVLKNISTMDDKYIGVHI